MTQTLACSRSAKSELRTSTTSSTSRPGRQGLVERRAHLLGVEHRGHRELDVLRLAGRARGRGVGVADARVRVEALAVGHGHAGTPQRPLERALEVAGAGEPQPPALGVAQAQPLDGRRDVADRCLTRHQPSALSAAAAPAGTRPSPRTGSAGIPSRVIAGGADLDLGAHLVADAAVEARRPAAVLDLDLGRARPASPPTASPCRDRSRGGPRAAPRSARARAWCTSRRRRPARRARSAPRPSSARTRSARSSRRSARRRATPAR